MKGTALIRNGDLLLSKDLRDFISANPEAECDIEIHVLNKPQHYLYKYLDGILIQDISVHSGMSHDEIKNMMKEKFAKVFINNLNEIPRRHRGKRTQIITVVDRDNNITGFYWIKSCSYMTHEELKEFVVNVENHFFDFMEGALDRKNQLEKYEIRKVGFMSDKEYKKYKSKPHAV